MNKISSRLASTAALLLFLQPATAQNVDLVTVEKSRFFQQSSASTPTLQTNLPYGFDVTANRLSSGGTIGGITAPTVTLAIGSTAPTDITTFHNGGVLVLNNSEWRYGSPNGNGYGTSSLSNLNSLFANGTYSVTAEGKTYSLDLDGDGDTVGFIFGIPQVTLSGGSWSGGKYLIDVSQPLTITSNNWQNLGSDQSFTTTGIGSFININVDGVGRNLLFSRMAPAAFSQYLGDGSTSTLSMTINANTLIAGTDYEGSLGFHRILGSDTTVVGVLGAALWTNETSFVISAIPEPSTYAAIFGAGAFGLALWRRRRT